MKLSTTGTIIGVDKTTGATNATATNNDAVKIGDMVFSFTATPTDGKITFTYEGYMKDGTTFTPTATDDKFTEAQATAINNVIGGGVKLGAVAGGEVSGNIIHDTTNVEYAKAITPSTMAGVDIDISSLVADGNKLIIDGTEYIFKTDASKTYTGNVIDVSAGKTDAERIHMAVDLLSKQTAITGQTDGANNGRTWTISSAGGTKIHIDQTAGTTDTTKALKTYADVAAVISGQKPATTEKQIGTNIKIENDKVAEGNTLNIDGTKYVFTEDKTGKTDTADTKYVLFTKGGTDAATNLQAAIGGTSEINADKDTVTVRAAQKGDAAPMVLGKGLTLQIGDTSDPWNQLNVTVQDMHANSLGIANLKINTEEAAQAAVDKIKAAINTVSDVRGTLGATQNRLDHTINNLSVMTENIQDAESTIRDTDVAEEMMAYTKNNILIQSAQAMLAQANQVPQGVLQLLQ
ncbi:MAG: hypothetical protein HFF17_04410 [Oscillospiraceae bacterium]|nr:hypothetical protein [Oscillospiraceae bacterium]